MTRSLSETITSKIQDYANAEGDDAQKAVAKVRRFQY